MKVSDATMEHVLFRNAWQRITRPGTAFVAGLGLMALITCGPGTDDPGSAAGGTSAEVVDPVHAEPLECERRGYPCTWDEVDSVATRRIGTVIAYARERAIAGATLDDLAEELAEREEVAWIQFEQGHALRFLVKGARPIWIMPPDTSASGTLSSAPLVPLVQSPEGGVAGPQTKEGKPKKTALFLAPYQFEANVDMAAYKKLFEGTKDFAGGGLKMVSNDYAATDRESGCTEENGPHCSPVKIETNYQNFRGWQQYDVIHVMTHGKQLCGFERQGEPVDAAIPCITALYTGWQARYRGPDGRYFSQQYGPPVPERAEAVKGVEYVWSMPNLLCRSYEDSRAGEEYDRLKELRETDKSIVLPEERYSLARLRDKGFIPIEEGSPMWYKYCLGEGPDGEILKEVVTNDFFFAEYEGGLPDKVIVLTACEAMRDRTLAKHLTANERSVVVGWTVEIEMKVADSIAYKFLEVLLDPPVKGDTATVEGHLNAAGARPGGGYWTDQLKVVVGTLGRTEELRSGNLVAVPFGDSDVADVGEAELVIEGLGTMRAREVVAILDQNQGGVELVDGGRASVVGVPGDGVDDRLDVVLELQGVSDSEDPAQFGLNLRVDGRDVPGTFTAIEPLGGGRFWARGPFDLGADLVRDQVSDLEVWASLPSGGISRWLYEDILLGLPCTFELTLGERTFRGATGDMLVSMGMSVGGHMISLQHQAGGINTTLMVEGTSPLTTGAYTAHLSGGEDAAAGPTSLGGETTLEISESTDAIVAGRATGVIMSLAPPYRHQEDLRFSLRFEIGRDQEVSQRFSAIGGLATLAQGMAGSGAIDPSVTGGLDLSSLMGGAMGVEVVGCEIR